MHEEKTKLLMALWQSFLASATDEKKKSNQTKKDRQKGFGNRTRIKKKLKAKWLNSGKWQRNRND
jgi:hypothetical protein